jgi:hypothetical protein
MSKRTEANTQANELNLTQTMQAEPANPSSTGNGTIANSAIEGPAMSRRAFATGAAAALGSLILEPIASSVAGNVYLFPGAEKAYAATDFLADATLPTVTVSPAQFCVMVYDGGSTHTDSDGEHKTTYYNAVQDAYVRVTSHDNSEVRTLPTNDDGCAFFNIEDFTAKKTLTGVGTYYEFYGDIEVYKNGMREMSFPGAYISDASATAVPTCSLNGKMFSDDKGHTCYVRTASLNGINIQYEKREFFAATENTERHKLYVELLAKDGGAYSIQPYISNSSTASRIGAAIADAQIVQCAENSPLSGENDYTCERKFASATFEGDFMNPGSQVFVAPDDEVSLEITALNENSDSETEYTQVTGFTTMYPPCGLAEQKGDTIVSLAENYPTTTEPMSTDQNGSNTAGLVRPQGNQVTLGDGFPDVLKGITLDIWTPSFPVIYKYDPSGRFIFGIDLQLLNFTNASETDDNSNNRYFHYADQRSIKRQIDRKVNAISSGFKTLTHTENKFAYNPAKPGLDFDFNIRVQSLIDLSFDKNSRQWSGELRTALGLMLDVGFTYPFVLFWVIPFYANIALTGDLSANIASNIVSDYDPSANSQTNGYNSAIHQTGRFPEYLTSIMKHLSILPSGAFRFPLHLKLSVSIAIGVKDFVAIGVRASGGFYLQWIFGVPKPQNKPYPRFIFGYDWSVGVFAQFLIYTAHKELIGGKDLTYYDTDKDSASATALAATEEARALAPSNGGSESFNPDEFSIVTEKTLASRAEISVTASTGAAYAAVATPNMPTVAAAESDTSEAFDAIRVNDFTACGAQATESEICAVAMSTISQATGNDNDDALLTAADADTADAESNATYAWPEGHAANPDASPVTDRVKGIGENGGVLPSRMDLIAKDVFSAPESKLIEVGKEGLYLFRLASVNYDGVTRNRVVFQRVEKEDGTSDISKPLPVEFQSQTVGAESRDDYYDYAFDVKLIRKNKDVPDILVMVLSGKRNEGDSSTIYSVAEATVLSIARMEFDYDAFNGMGGYVTASCETWSSQAFESAGSYFTFTSPQLQTRDLSVDETGFNQLGGDGREHALGYFTVHSAPTKELLLSPNDEDTQIGLGVIHFALDDAEKPQGHDALQFASVAMKHTVVTTVNDTLQPCPGDSSSLYSTLGYKTTNSGCGVMALKLTFDTNAVPYKLTGVSAFDAIAPDPLVKSLNPWNEKNRLLAGISTVEDMNSPESRGYLALCPTPTASELATIEGSGAAGAFDKSTSCVSSVKVPLGRIHVDADHKYCYYPSNHDGKGFYIYDDDGNPEPCDKDPENVIKAIVQADGVFTEPFTLADCGEHPIDAFCVIEDTSKANDAESKFVICSINDIDNINQASANLYSFDVPFLASVGVESLGLTGVHVHAGDDTQFSVTLKNNGNTVMTSANVVFTRSGDTTPLKSEKIIFSTAEKSECFSDDDIEYYEDAMSDSAKKSLLVVDGGAAALVPGQSRTFLVTIHIPEDWSGDCTIVAVASSINATVIDPVTGEQTRIPSDDSVVAGFDSTEYCSAKLTFNVAEPTETQLSAADVTEDLKGTGASGGSNVRENDNAGDSANGSDPSSGKTLSSTGDTVGAMSPVAMGLAAAGLGLAAYSARRAKLEGGTEEEE